MKRKLGEIQQINGKWYQLVKADKNNSCNGCSFFLSDDGKDCIIRCRNYGLIYKKLKIGGVPYSRDGKTYQAYIVPYTPYFYNGEYYACQAFNSRYFIAEINKEDMEENRTINQQFAECEQTINDAVRKCYTENKSTQIKDMEEYKIHDAKEDIPEFDKVVDECLFGKQELKLKPFDLQKAKAGKPICTRDGRKARIICFDRKDNTPIVALIERVNGIEILQCYHNNGRCFHYETSNNDLMMLLEKKEEWVNVYMEETNSNERLAEQVIYKTRKDAFDNACPRGYKATVKIEWEE